jgi:hypothetical protein
MARARRQPEAASPSGTNDGPSRPACDVPTTPAPQQPLRHELLARQEGPVSGDGVFRALSVGAAKDRSVIMQDEASGAPVGHGPAARLVRDAEEKLASPIKTRSSQSRELLTEPGVRVPRPQDCAVLCRDDDSIPLSVGDW